MPAGGLANPLAVSSQVGHRFGGMTWAEVRHGEVWRLVTATFIHFSLVHVGLNAFGLIKLGQLMEPWYGSGPFLALCMLIGGLGNLVGGLLRQILASVKLALAGSRIALAWPSWFEVGSADGVSESFLIQSGGGSTILLGLLGLGAVVGWRSKTRIGSFLRDQMVAMLGFTAVLGVILINLIDNYGHAGGAIVGAGLGFLHRPLLKLSERSRRFRQSCWVGVAVATLACLVAAVRDDRSEVGFRAEYLQAARRFELDLATRNDLDRISVLYARLYMLAFDPSNPVSELDLAALDPFLKQIAPAPLPSTPRPLTPDQWRVRTQLELQATLANLEARPLGTWSAATAAELAEMLHLAHRALDQAPDYAQVYAFIVAWRPAYQSISRDHDQAQGHLVELERRVR